MAARAIWKGVLKLDGERVPVKLYSAVQDRDVHFNILDEKTHTRVKQRMVNPESGKEVAPDEIRKGVAVEPGVFVVLDEDELQSLQPDPSRDIEILQFVPPERINHQWYERPYFLGPDGDDDSAYFALAEALSRSNREGLARWVMRNKRYVGALRVRDGYLTLVTLRHAEEVLSARELPAPSGRPLDQREVRMAEQLVSTLEDEFRPEDFRDEYRDRVLKFIESKAKGQKPKLVTIKRKEPPDSLMQALSASLKTARQRGGKAVA